MSNNLKLDYNLLSYEVAKIYDQILDEDDEVVANKKSIEVKLMIESFGWTESDFWDKAMEEVSLYFNIH